MKRKHIIKLQKLFIKAKEHYKNETNRSIIPDDYGIIKYYMNKVKNIKKIVPAIKEVKNLKKDGTY